MKKEKKVRTYQRRTKSGKTITVRAHTASYEAADKAKEAAKKKGAGDEFSSKVKKGEEWKLPMNEFLDKLKEERAQKREDEEPKKFEDEKPKKKSEKKTPAKKATKKRTVGTGINGPEPKKKATTKKTAANADTSEPAFTKDEFKEWYRGTGSAADKKVAKALRKQLGRSGYRKFEDEAIDNYTSRGHLSMFKRVSGSSASAKSAGVSTKVTTKSSKAKKGFTTVAAQKDLIRKDKDKYNTLKESGWKTKRKNTLGETKGADSSKESSKSSISKSLAKRWDSTPPNDKMDAKARKADAPKSEAEFVKRLKNEAGKSRGVGSIFNSGTTTYRGSDYDLYKKRGTYYAVNRKTGKLASEKSTNLIVKNWESAAKDSKKETSKKRSVGTGTNGPEPKKVKAASAPSMKKELAHLLTGVNGSTLRTWKKPAKFLSRKDGTLEASADYSKMGSNLRKAGWKNVDTVSIVGGTSNYVSPDGKYHAIVGSRKTKIKPIKKGEKVSGHSWDSTFGGDDYSASRYD